MRFAVLVLSAACAALGGCANVLKVTYQSDPPGAAVYQGNERWGYTPLTLEYELSPEDKRAGFKVLQGTAVKWASGATASVPTLTANLAQFGLTQQFTFQRPDGVPGRDIDIRFYLEMEKLNLMKQQAKAEQDRAFWEALKVPQRQTRATNCTSTVIGNTVQTICN